VRQTKCKLSINPPAAAGPSNNLYSLFFVPALMRERDGVSDPQPVLIYESSRFRAARTNLADCQTSGRCIEQNRSSLSLSRLHNLFAGINGTRFGSQREREREAAYIRRGFIISRTKIRFASSRAEFSSSLFGTNINWEERA